DDVGVVSRAARHGVGSAAAIEAIRRGVAGKDVGERVAGRVDRARAGEGQVLDVRRKDPGDAALDGVRTGAGCLGGDVADGVDDVGVVAETADHRVEAGQAVQDVVAAVAGERVGQGVARAVDGAGAGQQQVLDLGRERPGDARLDRIRPAGGDLDRRVPGDVDDVGVVAGPARHGVDAGAAVAAVVGGVARAR